MSGGWPSRQTWPRRLAAEPRDSHCDRQPSWRGCGQSGVHVHLLAGHRQGGADLHLGTGGSVGTLRGLRPLLPHARQQSRQWEMRSIGHAGAPDSKSGPTTSSNHGKTSRACAAHQQVASQATEYAQVPMVPNPDRPWR